MKATLMISAILTLHMGAYAQEENVIKSKHETKVIGIDPFGAHVTVVYNGDNEKVYQERTLNGETTFAYFEAGNVTEYGTVVKPALITSDLPLNQNEE